MQEEPALLDRAMVPGMETAAMQNDMVALRAVMRLGWEIPNPVNSQQKDKAKRCPFAVLAPAE